MQINISISSAKRSDAPFLAALDANAMAGQAPVDKDYLNERMQFWRDYLPTDRHEADPRIKIALDMYLYAGYLAIGMGSETVPNRLIVTDKYREIIVPQLLLKAGVDISSATEAQPASNLMIA